MLTSWVNKRSLIDWLSRTNYGRFIIIIQSRCDRCILDSHRGGNRNRSFRVRLAGRASNKNGVGAKVDIRAGSLRQRLETSAVTPAWV